MTTEHQPPRDIPTGERVASIARASADAMAHVARGETETEHGAQLTVEPGIAEHLVEGWPDAPKNVARQLLEKYGPPNEATRTKLFWYRAGPWKRIELTSDVVVHNFPSPHSDFLTQFIDYRVPVERVSLITEFDGSCLVDRTAGEVGARCDSEAANVLTLNLMHEVASGERSVENAREAYAENLMGYTMGRSAPLVDSLRFDVPSGGTEDPDKSMAGGAMLHQTVGKVKDALSGS